MSAGEGAGGGAIECVVSMTPGLGDNSGVFTCSQKSVSFSRLAFLKGHKGQKANTKKASDTINGKLSKLSSGTRTQNLIGGASTQGGTHATGCALNQNEQNDDEAKENKGGS